MKISTLSVSLSEDLFLKDLFLKKKIERRTTKLENPNVYYNQDCIDNQNSNDVVIKFEVFVRRSAASVSMITTNFLSL